MINELKNHLDELIDTVSSTHNHCNCVQLKVDEIIAWFKDSHHGYLNLLEYEANNAHYDAQTLNTSYDYYNGLDYAINRFKEIFHEPD